MLPLPISPVDAVSMIVEPALLLLPESMTSKKATCLLIAIALQESRLTYRKQLGNGPARGLWQFERAGGVAGVLSHAASKRHAIRACSERGVPPEPRAAWE